MRLAGRLDAISSTSGRGGRIRHSAVRWFGLFARRTDDFATAHGRGLAPVAAEYNASQARLATGTYHVWFKGAGPSGPAGKYLVDETR